MTTIHIKATSDTDDKIVSEIMNILIKHGFQTEKYESICFKIIMAKKESSIQKRAIEKLGELKT